MKLTLEQAQALSKEQSRKQAFNEAGLEYQPRVPHCPKDDEELQAILEREKQFLRDDRTPARIQGISSHLDKVDRQIDKLVYRTEITEDILREIGLLTVLFHYHLERIEIGDNNPLAKELLAVFQSHN